ncbi:MAG: hypothetical protein DSY47_07030 [Hydrogenothermus sp.]|nr:MAG: hypothetical protein DSY47_07030 [Hydrogenothermus sp.]
MLKIVDKTRRYIMRKAFLSLLLVLTTVLSSIASEKVVYIDIKKVFIQSKAGVDIKNYLQKKADEARNYIQTKASLVDKNNPQAMQELQQEAMKKQQEINELQQRIVNKFTNFIKNAVDEFAKKNGYELVVDKQAVLFGQDKYDKTKEFLTFFDEKYQKEKPKFE